MVFRSKVVVRQLPPNITIDEVNLLLQKWSLHIDYQCLHPGKVYNYGSSKPARNAVLFLNFTAPEALLDFAQTTTQNPFIDSFGVEHQLVVEFAPFQQIPSSPEDTSLQGKIEEDQDFLSFVENMKRSTEVGRTTMVSSLEAITKEKEASLVTSPTPLVKYLMEMKMGKDGGLASIDKNTKTKKKNRKKKKKTRGEDKESSTTKSKGSFDAEDKIQSIQTFRSKSRKELETHKEYSKEEPASSMRTSQDSKRSVFKILTKTTDEEMPKVSSTIPSAEPKEPVAAADKDTTTPKKVVYRRASQSNETIPQVSNPTHQVKAKGGKSGGDNGEAKNKKEYSTKKKTLTSKSNAKGISEGKVLEGKKISPPLSPDAPLFYIDKTPSSKPLSPMAATFEPIPPDMLFPFPEKLANESGRVIYRRSQKTDTPYHHHHQQQRQPQHKGSDANTSASTDSAPGKKGIAYSTKTRATRDKS